MQTDSLKKLLKFPLGFHMAYEKSKADGTVGLDDLAHFVPALIDLPSAISNAGTALEELKDLDEVERRDVLDWAKAEYDLADDVLEARVEAGLGLVLELARFLGELNVIGTDKAEAVVEQPPA